ncbi:hypothetical protein E2C01_006092 [Portunus trituberculatus]|uniref:Uncharacterized protein n=1 Tax=Portunus trituberculatus TaxID=210409 RepID=A0A5B7CVF5_PORTR|nr:hypothetical protein [Portunus trituberculatus]
MSNIPPCSEFRKGSQVSQCLVSPPRRVSGEDCELHYGFGDSEALRVSLDKCDEEVVDTYLNDNLLPATPSKV